jgi:hypothetical protein
MSRSMHLVPTLLAALAVAAGSEPGAPGYVLPWNRPACDTVVDLAAGARGARMEFTGRLVSDLGAPVEGVVVYVYHADAHGLYGTRERPEIPLIAGTVRTGAGGGFVVRSIFPGMYEGPPHVHLEAILPGRGRCATFVSFYPDSATYPIEGTMGLGPERHPYSEHEAIVHRDADGVLRTTRTIHTGNWNTGTAAADSAHRAAEHKYERGAPWRSAGRRAAP